MAQAALAPGNQHVAQTVTETSVPSAAVSELAESASINYAENHLLAKLKKKKRGSNLIKI